MSLDTSRINSYSDKKTLADVTKYFKAFVTHDADASRDMQIESYTMTNVGEPIPHLVFAKVPSSLSLLLQRCA